jgi:hypothetical protein
MGIVSHFYIEYRPYIALTVTQNLIIESNILQQTFKTDFQAKQ